MRELGLIKRLFCMLDEVTQDEIVIAMDALIIELEREAAEVAHQRARRIAINAWRQTIRRNTRCSATLESLAFLETHERIAPRLKTDAVALEKRASKHHYRHTLEA